MYYWNIVSWYNQRPQIQQHMFCQQHVPEQRKSLGQRDQYQLHEHYISQPCKSQLHQYHNPHQEHFGQAEDPVFLQIPYLFLQKGVERKKKGKIKDWILFYLSFCK